MRESPPTTPTAVPPPPAGPSALAAGLVDAAAPAPVLVFGSLPPGGRDLDLLVRAEHVPVLERVLAGAGFERDGDVGWVRFGLGTADAVDLVPAEDWRLGEAQLARLLAEASPVDGFRRLVRPAPADDLLVLARRGLGVQAPLAERHRARVADAVARDPDAFDRAAARARDWRVRWALAALRAAAGGVRPALHVRILAASETAALRGAPPQRRARAVLRALRARPARPRGAVVALSGIDGSGKSTQAAALAATLRALGHDAVVEWSRITYDPMLRAIAAPAKRVFAGLSRLRGGALDASSVHRNPWDPPATAGDVAAKGLRDRVPVVNHAWVLVVALVHAIGQRRTLRGHLRAGRIVVRDRYVLDATVQLEDRYGDGRGAGLPGRALRALCPDPLLAFWLDVDPQTAHARKPEEYSAADLVAHRARYDAVHRRLGVVRVDASGAPEAVAAELARQTWRRLR